MTRPMAKIALKLFAFSSLIGVALFLWGYYVKGWALERSITIGVMAFFFTPVSSLIRIWIQKKSSATKS